MNHPDNELKLNAEQEVAVASLLEFIQDPDPISPFFTFAGYAGTGKTFCMREVVAHTAGSHTNFAYTAPTNKAAKVLKKVTGEAGTIFSLLGLRIDKNGELKSIVAGKPPEGLDDIDCIFVDEASMVNRNLLKELKANVEKFKFKVVFMGDPAQLPPVGEVHSPIWDLGTDASLSKVMRHDNQILELVTEIRGVIDSPAPCITIKSNHDETGGVWKMQKRDFQAQIYNAAANGAFADGDMTKVVAWRNVKVNEYNTLIRNALWGVESQSVPWMPGERIVAGGPCERNDVPLMTTDEEAIVESVLECVHPLAPKYKAIELKSVTEAGKTVRLMVLHPASAGQFAQDSEQLAHQARTNPKMWKKFWDHKDLFHDIRYAYAITAHRAQGSTYQDVYVDYQDILLNRTRREAFQCLYVACSRPTTRLYLA
jgi:exodeoxyribonuclease-5